MLQNWNDFEVNIITVIFLAKLQERSQCDNFGLRADQEGICYIPFPSSQTYTIIHPGDPEHARIAGCIDFDCDPDEKGAYNGDRIAAVLASLVG